MSSFALNTHSRRRKTVDPPVGVVICAASASARAELEQRFEPQASVEVLGAVPSTKQLRSMLTEVDPDVVFLDLDAISEDTSWKDLLGFGTNFVLLVKRLDSASLEAAITEGVAAILLGDRTGAELAAAALAAASGLFVFSRELVDLVRHGLAGHKEEYLDDPREENSPQLEGLPERLTPREQEVLEMLSEGLSNKEIAALLNISVHTAKFHISSILGKLGASSRAEATGIGLRRGLITV